MIFNYNFQIELHLLVIKRQLPHARTMLDKTPFISLHKLKRILYQIINNIIGVMEHSLHYL